MSILAPEDDGPLLRVAGLSAYYGELRALTNIGFEIERGEILSIIGANGAGKTTLLKSLVGLMSRGRLSRIEGRIEFEGRAIEHLSTEDIVNAGMALVPEGRRLFSRLSVQENLMAGAYLPRCRGTLKERLDEIFALFPVLAERRRQIVSQMSGGEQQMVAIGRALMSSPTLILFDELSLGLAPSVVDDIYRKVRQIHELGATAIVIEQDMKRALRVASHVFVMLEGHVVLEARPEDVTEEQVSAAYFGTEIEGFG